MDIKGVYVLQLEKDKFYVGWASSVSDRIQVHKNGTGAEWTKRYKPISTVFILPNGTLEDELIITLQYMSKYGVDNVRGGPWVSMHLADPPNVIIHHIANNCYRCGKDGHYVSQCSHDSEQSNEMQCVRCGRRGHIAQNCTETQDITGYTLRDRVCFRCGYTSHIASNCWARKTRWGQSIHSEHSDSESESSSSASPDLKRSEAICMIM